MRAILLAAGVGSRLAAAAAGRPKILLEFDGRSLLERHVDNLRGVGITEAVVVVGHRAELVERETARLADSHGMSIRTVRNPRFREGSVLSIAAAGSFVEEEAAPLLLMDGDVLYPRLMLERLLGSVHGSALLLDRDCALNELDPVLVPVRDGRPVDFCKGFRGTWDLIGESVGLFKLGADEVRAWRDAVEEIADESGGAASFEDVVQRLVRQGRFGHEDITGVAWIEIDFPSDLERAREKVLPALAWLEEENAP